MYKCTKNKITWQISNLVTFWSGFWSTGWDKWSLMGHPVTKSSPYGSDYLIEKKCMLIMTVRLSQLFSRISVALPKMDSTKQFQKPSSSHMKSNRANIPKYVLISWAITWVLFKIDNNKILKYHFFHFLGVIQRHNKLHDIQSDPFFDFRFWDSFHALVLTRFEL